MKQLIERLCFNVLLQLGYTTRLGKWIDITKQKPILGQRFLAIGYRINPETGEDEREWGVFTAPTAIYNTKGNNVKEIQKSIDQGFRVAEQKLELMIKVYRITKWMVPSE